MNAIVSLCHFCELHGPSVLFCTQAFHLPDPHHVLENDNSLEDSGSYYVREQSLRSSSDGAASPNPSEHPSPAKTSDLCEACRSLAPGQPGYISNDHEAKVSYVSGQHPDHPQVFAMVRQACVRSLSCEVCPGREGPIFFGDSHRGHVLSHTFFIKDSQARGFHRWYSVIVVMMDKIYLLNSWPFLVTHIKSVIDGLQDKANKVYEDEQAKCPQRAHRLTISMTPANFRHTRGGTKPARSLIELTKDKHVFRSLHQSFTWILKAGGNRLTERLLEGPPTEDSIIDLEKQEETEEGFTLLFSKKVVDEDPVEDQVEEDFIDDDPNTPSFKNLRHLMKVLGYGRFHTLAHHVVVGNQIIIRGRQKTLIKSMIECIKNLLPRGCCRAIIYSAKYEDSWRCNFLGVPPNTIMPPHLDLCVVVDIKPPEDSGDLVPPEWDEFKGYNFKLSSPAILPEKGPAILKKMEFFLLNETLADSVVDHCLTCLKEEWMNKVKVLFKFTKAGGNRSEEDTRKLLQVVGAQDEDKQVLKFWMTGLSVQYRNHMLSSAISQAVAR